MTRSKSDTWKDQFTSSYYHQLDEYETVAGQTRQVDFFNSDQYLEKVFDTQTDKGIFTILTLRSLAFEVVSHRSMAVQKAHDLCGSPIESAMLAALTIIANEGGLKVCYINGSEFNPLDYGISDDFYIEPQAQIGTYRVDFLITVKLKDFLNVSDESMPPSVVSHQMVIECDGHDYHERTKEQARSDKERDRKIQSSGFQVFRYTGSEIWVDVFKCASEAFRALMKEAYMQAGRDNSLFK